MKLMKLIFTILVFACISGCMDYEKYPDSKIVITNHSSIDVVVYYQIKNQYDTLLASIQFSSIISQIDDLTVKPDSSIQFKGSFLSELGKNNKESVLMVFFFSRDTLETVGVDKIMDEYLVLDRQDKSLINLKKDNWVFEFGEE